jgi:hypothetical protein
MSIAAPGRARELTTHEPLTADRRDDRVRKALLSCGIVSTLVYVAFNELAATRWDGYSRMSQAISELSSIGAPSRPVLIPWLAIVYTPLVIAFGVGVWRSAHGDRALQVIGALMIAYGISGPLWLPFPMTLRSEIVAGATMPLADVMHIVLAGISAVTWLGAMGAGAFTSRRRFRIFSAVAVTAFLALTSATFLDAARVAAQEPTPYLGLVERGMFAVFFAWTVVLAIALWREQTDRADARWSAGPTGARTRSRWPGRPTGPRRPRSRPRSGAARG